MDCSHCVPCLTLHAGRFANVFLDNLEAFANTPAGGGFRGAHHVESESMVSVHSQQLREALVDSDGCA